jgi:hypothetical protein
MSQLMPALTVRSVLAAAAWAACAVMVLTAQARPVPDIRDAAGFSAAMVRIDDDWTIVDEAIDGPTYLLNSVRGDGLTRLDRIATELTAARAFLAAHSRTDAARLAQEALQAVAALRAELTRAEPDQAAAQEEAQYVRTSCAACHDRFREGDATAGFRFKPGVID